MFPEQRIQIFEGNQTLPVISGINLELTAAQIFEWLHF